VSLPCGAHIFLDLGRGPRNQFKTSERSERVIGSCPALREIVALSRISELEKQFNVQLLYRTARGVELTPSGSALLFHARQILNQVDEMQIELSDYAKGIKG